MSTMTNILLSYAGRDANYRSLLVAATRASGLPVRFVEVPGVVADPASRRALCAAKLQQCEAAIVLLSPHAAIDPAVACDVAAAEAAGVPLHGIRVAGSGAILRRKPEWTPASVVSWNWPRIAAFLQRLPRFDRSERLIG